MMINTFSFFSSKLWVRTQSMMRWCKAWSFLCWNFVFPRLFRTFDWGFDWNSTVWWWLEQLTDVTEALRPVPTFAFDNCDAAFWGALTLSGVKTLVAMARLHSCLLCTFTDTHIKSTHDFVAGFFSPLACIIMPWHKVVRVKLMMCRRSCCSRIEQRFRTAVIFLWMISTQSSTVTGLLLTSCKTSVTSHGATHPNGCWQLYWCPRRPHGGSSLVLWFEVQGILSYHHWDVMKCSVR